MKYLIIFFLSFFFIALVQAQEPELVLPVGHTGNIIKEQTTPDKKYVVTASEDGTAKIWNNRNYKLRFNLVLHTGPVTDMAMSSDGSFVVLGSSDGTYSKWEVATGKLLYHAPKRAPVERLYLLPGDSILVLQKELTMVKSWMRDNVDDELFADDNSQYIKLFTLSPDKKFFVFCREWDGLCFYDAVTCERISTSGNRINAKTGFYEMSRLKPKSISFLNEHTVVLRTDYQVTAFFNVQTGAQTFLNERWLADVDVSSNGRYASLLHAGKDTVTVYNLQTNQSVAVLVLSKKVKSVKGFTATDSQFVVETDVTVEEFKIDGTAVATKPNQGTIVMVDNDRYKGNVEALKKTFMSAGGSYLFEIRQSYANYWNIKSGRSIRLPVQGEYNKVSDIHETGDESKIIIQYYSSWALYDLEREQILYLKEVGSSFYLAFNKQKTELITASENYLFTRWNLSTGDQSEEWKLPHRLAYITVSPDGHLLAGVKESRNNDSIQVWNINTRQLVTTVHRPGQYIEGGWLTIYTPNYRPALEFSANSQYLFYSTGEQGFLSAVHLPYWEYDAGGDSSYYEMQIMEFPEGYMSRHLPMVQQTDTSFLFYSLFWPESKEKPVLVYDYKNEREICRLNYPSFQRILGFSNASKYLYTTTDKEFLVWDVRSCKLLKQYPLPAGFRAVMYYESFNKLVIESNDRMGVLEPGSKKPVYYLSTFSSGDYIVYRSDRYYQVTPDAVRWLTWKSGSQFYDFDQWDIQYNRPDKIIEVMDQPESQLAAAYYKAYQKRLKKTGINEKIFKPGLKVPVTKIIDPAEEGEIVTSEQYTIKLECSDQDPSSSITSVSITINDVPVYISTDLKTKSVKAKLQLTVPLLLSTGENRISISCMNDKGVESIREQVMVRYNPVQPVQETIYFIGIGINRFADPKHNLQWCVKDIRDMAAALKEKYGTKIIIDTLFDQQVTLSSVKAIKEKLIHTTINDKVIVAYSGHGLLSKAYDYYLSSYTVNFSKPEENGIPYEEIEFLLDGIPARKKLLLIDACHSGEVDKEEMITIQNRNRQSSTEGVVMYKGSEEEMVQTKTVGLQNSFELMQTLFVNIGKGTGTTIISAAGGVQFAQERGDLKNGVFTFSLLEAMKQYQTITVSALKKYVGARVERLTNGLQKPTTRNELKSFDWNVW